MLSTILFIVSDLFMLLNVISILNTDLKSLFHEKKYGMLLLIAHMAFAAFFTTGFPILGKATKILLLIVYFIRFIVIPFLLSQKISFNLFYLPVLFISINSLFQRSTYWITIQFNPEINENIVTKTASLVLQIAIFTFITLINTRKNRFATTFKFSMRLISKPVSILILLSIFITEGMISLVTYDTDKFAQQKNTIANLLSQFTVESADFCLCPCKRRTGTAYSKSCQNAEKHSYKKVHHTGFTSISISSSCP